MNTLRVDIALYNKQMKLPGAKNAVVTPDKTTKYLLSATHASGRHKARFFVAFGFSADWFVETNEIIPNFVTAYPL